MYDWKEAAQRLKELESAWSEELGETERRRAIRYEDVSVQRLRAEKKIKPDATYIVRRIADANIRRELAPYIAYITQSRDVAKFRCLSASGIPPEPLEREFTTFAQYPRWQLPLFQTLDGTATHGWDAVEILFDDSKPGHFCVRHIGHENLIFSTDVTDIQDSPVCEVLYGSTITELAKYVEDYDFVKTQVDKVREQLRSQKQGADSKVILKKVYFKDEDDGTVYVGWGCEYADDWLSKPQRLHLGLEGDESYDNTYPIEVLQYSVSEDEIIMRSKGRVYMDEHDQEACIQLVTAFVNRAIRSTYILSSPVNPGDESAAKQSEITLGDGVHISVPVNFFNIEPPDPGLLQAMMTITNQNANEIGQVNFAVTNRKDSRKTATEIQTANQQSAMLNSVQVTLLSTFLQNVWTCCWKIARSQVLQNKIQSNILNWQNWYNQEWTLLPAGDADVIRRAEILNAMKQDWPVMQQTAAAQAFLEDIIRSSPYSEKADKYIAAIEAGNRKDNLIRGMRNALQSLVVDPQTGQPRPEVAGAAEQYKELAMEYADVMKEKPQNEPEQEPAAEAA